MSDRCDFCAVLSRQGLRPTALRLGVLEILANSGAARRAPEILESLRARRRVNKVTVYRILEDLSRLGLIRKLPMEGRAALYELACEHHPPHPHFQCHACGEVQCLDPVPLEQVWEALRSPLGNLAEGMHIRVEGICVKCREGRWAGNP